MKKLLFGLLFLSAAVYGQKKVVIKSMPVAINPDSIKNTGSTNAPYLLTEKAKLAKSVDSARLKQIITDTLLANSTYFSNKFTGNGTLGDPIDVAIANSGDFTTDVNVRKSAPSVVFDENGGGKKAQMVLSGRQLRVQRLASNGDYESTPFSFHIFAPTSFSVDSSGNTSVGSSGHATNINGTPYLEQWAGTGDRPVYTDQYGRPQVGYAPLTGYTSGAGTVSATDNILQAIQKLNGNDALKANLASPTITGAVTLPAIRISARSAVADVARTMTSSDWLVAWTTLTATRAYTLGSAASFANYYIILKDEAGAAGTNNITIVGTVNGVSNPTAINTNYGTYKIYSNGTAWFTW